MFLLILAAALTAYLAGLATATALVELGSRK